MFSMPPANATSTLPSKISCAAETMAWAPEPQTRFTVIAGTETGTFDAGADREGAEIGRGHVFETAAERADGGANRSGENDRARCTHGGTSWVRSRPARPRPDGGRAAFRSARPIDNERICTQISAHTCLSR